MKKAAYVIIAIALVCVLILSLIYIPGKINDYNLAKYTKEVLSSIKIPQDTEIVEYVAGCGNSTGAGDHTDLYVAVLLKSELSWQDLSKTFGRVHIVETQGNKTLAMDIIGLEFETKADDMGYYIVELRKSGILDWRGW